MHLMKKRNGKVFFITVLCCLMLLFNCLDTLAADSEGLAKVGLSGGAEGSSTGLPDLFTGTMSYSIPIEVPPGRKGMDPGIALTYRSSNGNGWLGVGWELEVGSIQRSTKNGIDYNGDSYQFRKNGATVDLVKVGSSDYRAKIEEGFTKITQMPATAYSDWQPYWVATDKAGVRFFYGQTAASRQDDTPNNNPDRIFKWCLNRVEDTDGNFIDITYFKAQGQIYLDQISYTGNGAMAPTNYVKFNLERRDDAEDMYSTNFKVVTGYRLKTIGIFGPNNTNVGAYDFIYESSGSTRRSLLKKVNKYGSDVQWDATSPGVILAGSSFISVVSLDWINNGYSMKESGGPGLYPYSNRIYPGDFNGDGFTDQYFIRGDGGGWVLDHSLINVNYFSRSTTIKIPVS